MSDVDTALAESSEALDPNRPIREADMCGATGMSAKCQKRTSDGSLRYIPRCGAASSNF